MIRLYPVFKIQSQFFNNYRATFGTPGLHVIYVSVITGLKLI